VSTDVLIDRFWPDGSPETARAALQTHVSALRRQLGDNVIVTEGYGYRLNLSDHNLDADVFAALAAESGQYRARGQWVPALGSIESALSMWRGEDAFTDLADDDYAQPERARLEELHLSLLEQQAEGLIALGREEEALPRLEALVIEHPYRERLWEQLMTARYRLGRHTEALRAFQEVKNHLAEIGVEPAEPLRRLEEKILLHDRSLTRTKHNLPTELDAFIGREAEIDQVARLLAENRLVSLIGAGGSGKTRLAVHLAYQLLDSYPDGIWFVELADIDDPDLILSQIAADLGLSGGDTEVLQVLEKVFSTEAALLILDNCEHVAGRASEIAASLLRAAPRLTVLTTSRQPLKTPGEQLFQVPGLTLPESTDDRTALNTDGVRLFDIRATQADSEFDITEELGAVVAICRRLDAMPLAIELAAARVSSLGVDEIERNLDSSIEFLSSGYTGGHSRHQTLQAAIEWSYRLASDDEREALALLSVFRGGFDMDMASWMLGEDAPRLVAELVDRSLISSYRGSIRRRYRLLETIRQFALTKAVEHGLASDAFQRHADWCVSFAEHIWSSWQKPGWDQIELAIGEEFENMSSALERAEAWADGKLAGRIAEGLLWYWQLNGYLSRAIDLYDLALETCQDDDRRVGLLAKRALVRFNANDPESASVDAEAAYQVSESLSPSIAKAYAVSTYAHLVTVRPDLDARDGIKYAEEALAIAAETHNDVLVASLHVDLATALAWAGQLVEARPVLEKAVTLAEHTGDPRTVAYTYTSATTVAAQFAELRREAIGDYSDRLIRWCEQHPQVASMLRFGWVEWAMIQRGDLREIEAKLAEWSAEDHLEGFPRLGNLIPRGVAIWMQGRLEHALRVVAECEAVGVNPRWYHDFCPLKVDVLVDLGRLDAAVAAADVYLDFATDASESAKKLGVLNPLVRGVADLGEDGPTPGLVSRGRSIIERMQSILAEHPPPMDGSVSMETHTTHLLFAEAELTRLTGADPTAWRAAMDAADYIYFRLYAQTRFGEALLATGQTADGMGQLEDASSEARRIGAARIARLADRLLSS
jgi:predicted ATPase/DNA-binding SARP family transcriptional activator